MITMATAGNDIQDVVEKAPPTLLSGCGICSSNQMASNTSSHYVQCTFKTWGCGHLLIDRVIPTITWKWLRLTRVMVAMAPRAPPNTAAETGTSMSVTMVTARSTADPSTAQEKR